MDRRGEVAAHSAACFSDRLESFGDRTALVCADGHTLTYRALAALADAAAADFPAAPTLTAITMRSDWQSVVLYLAALRHGHPALLLGDVQAPAAARILETYRPWLPGTPHPVDAPATHPELAILLSTSGTTGSPRLVRLSRRNIEANARAIVDYLGIGPDDRAITSLPLHYSYGLSVLHSHLAAGASIVLTDNPVSTPAFWALFDAQAVTSLAGVPFSYEVFERVGLRDRALPGLRTMTQAGGRLAPDMVAAYARWSAARGIRFFVMYGATEATARMAYLPPDKAAQHSDCIGVPIPGGSFSLRPLDGMAPGVGELIYRGANVMMGYAEGPEDLARAADSDELATGDLAEVTKAGLFRIVGRTSRFSKLFGLRLSHDEIERQLLDEGVTAIVTGNDRHVVVAAIGEGAGEIGPVLAARHGLPRASFVVLSMAEFPRLASGKPDYGAIARAGDATAVAAAGTAQAGIEAIFATTFPRATIGAGDSFARLGGDSLNYVDFSIALEKLLGSVPPGWEDMTVAALSALRPSGLRHRRLVSVESDVVLRAAAITGVVALHAGVAQTIGVGLAGGSPLLMILFGHSLARFKRQQLISDGRWSVMVDFLRRIILPYYVLLIAYGLSKQQVDLPSMLLASHWFGRFGSVLEPYWFLEAIVQCLLMLTLLFCVPRLRRLAEASPWRFAAFLLGLGIVMKIAGSLAIDHGHLQHRTLDATFLFVAIGWAAWQVRDLAARLGIALLAVGLAASNWGFGSTQVVWLAIAMPVLLLVPRIPMPAAAGSVTATVARASFQIYLSHIFVIYCVERLIGISAPVPTGLLAIMAGIGLWWLQREAGEGLRRAGKAAPAEPGRASPD